MIWNSLFIDIGIVHMAWSVEYFFGWRVVVPGPELCVATRIVSIAVPDASTLFSFTASSLESCGYLVVVVIIVRYAPLTVISLGSIVFRWSCSLVVLHVLSICKPVSNAHEFWYCSRSGPAHLLDEVWTTMPEYEGVNCSLRRWGVVANFA
jgi:hypothetical protein